MLKVCFWGPQLTRFFTSRSSYQHHKKIAATSRKIFTGEEVAPIKTVPKDQALWMITLGEGFGRKQYRLLSSLLTLRLGLFHYWIQLALYSDLELVFWELEGVFGELEEVFGEFEGVFGEKEGVFGELEMVIGNTWQFGY